MHDIVIIYGADCTFTVKCEEKNLQRFLKDAIESLDESIPEEMRNKPVLVIIDGRDRVLYLYGRPKKNFIDISHLDDYIY